MIVNYDHCVLHHNISILMVAVLLIDELEFKVINYRTEVLELDCSVVQLSYWFVRISATINLLQLNWGIGLFIHSFICWTFTALN